MNTWMEYFFEIFQPGIIPIWKNNPADYKKINDLINRKDLYEELKGLLVSCSLDSNKFTCEDYLNLLKYSQSVYENNYFTDKLIGNENLVKMGNFQHICELQKLFQQKASDNLVENKNLFDKYFSLVSSEIDTITNEIEINVCTVDYIYYMFPILDAPRIQINELIKKSSELCNSDQFKILQNKYKEMDNVFTACIIKQEKVEYIEPIIRYYNSAKKKISIPENYYDEIKGKILSRPNLEKNLGSFSKERYLDLLKNQIEINKKIE